MDVVSRLDRLTKQNPLCLFLRGDPNQPTCAESRDMAGIISQCGAPYHAVNVQLDPELRAFLGKYSESAEIPQLFLNGEYLGGAQVVRELYAQGELRPMIESCSQRLRLAG